MDNENNTFTATAVQMAPVFLNKDETIGKVASLIDDSYTINPDPSRYGVGCCFRHSISFL